MLRRRSPKSVLKTASKPLFLVVVVFFWLELEHVARKINKPRSLGSGGDGAAQPT